MPDWFADLYVLTGRGGFCPVVSGRSLVGLARGSRAAFGLAFPGCASRLATDCGLAQQRRDSRVWVSKSAYRPWSSSTERTVS